MLLAILCVQSMCSNDLHGLIQLEKSDEKATAHEFGTPNTPEETKKKAEEKKQKIKEAQEKAKAEALEKQAKLKADAEARAQKVQEEKEKKQAAIKAKNAEKLKKFNAAKEKNSNTRYGPQNDGKGYTQAKKLEAYDGGYGSFGSDLLKRKGG